MMGPALEVQHLDLSLRRSFLQKVKSLLADSVATAAINYSPSPAIWGWE